MIAVILGTRPEIIKMSPVIRECEAKELDFFILHTGQHYSYEMDKMFFDELELPLPWHNLEIGSGSHAEQTGRILAGVERALVEERPDIVLVQGDTNTVLAGALAAKKLHIRVGHIEAGLRSFDRSMPEEVNRVVTDHISDYLFAPTKTAETNLLNEGIDRDNIHVMGNTVVDALYQNLEISRKKSGILAELGLKPKEYFLVTAHRQENVDSEERLKNIIECLRLIHNKYSLPVIFPMHPHTVKRIDEFGIDTEDINVIKPLGYLSFLQLEANARLILTDSGGIQEEACILGVPLVTLRDNTERPETLDVGSNVVAGTDPVKIFESVGWMMRKDNRWKNPFGDGDSAKRIVRLLQAEQN
ncbi:MAG TPA: UDP-N-acetylglucosamine 2-epimerase (non-hydrolyzing) [Methanocella sp.]|uniref:non-hydrolyzing UDP-N-acetylglucosamine 2-epimerase n=1 Tax=Methanocella sp. TaxID=2052833 RepID=UPI002B645D4F|nr:UDP-N-acetylglucosamine 2-epimerase (non-hydrolyzing) [Methanocella sp.]HTY90764.1 UDP-N-acetylglucosamine 2-epimerase (non-hydrolyzing) [Methanocella sp.]